MKTHPLKKEAGYHKLMIDVCISCLSVKTIPKVIDYFVVRFKEGAVSE